MKSVKSVKSVKFLAFNSRVLNAALASVLALGGTGLVGNAYAITATASANVVQAITVEQTRALNFGKFVASSGGTVVLTPVDTTGVSGSSVRVTPSTATSGTFTVRGDGTATYTITVDATATLAHSVTSTNTMAVSAITPSVTTGGVLGGTTGSEGTQIVYVGATLTQGTANISGTYNGTYNVTVAYN